MQAGFCVFGSYCDADKDFGSVSSNFFFGGGDSPPDRPRINTVHTCNYACISGLQATWAGSVAAMCGRIRYTLYFIKFNENVVKLIHKNED